MMPPRRNTAWPRALLLLAPCLTLASLPARAHHAMGEEIPSSLLEGLLSGLAHPVIGLDHLAFLVAAGVLAACCRSGGARLPLLFVAASLGGTLLRVGGLPLGPVELAVAASLLAAGGLLLLRPPFAESPGLLAALFLGAGLFHGAAFAEAIIGAEPTPLLAYLLGLGAIQAVLAYGVFAWVRRAGGRPGTAPGIARWAGAAASAVGVVAIGLALAGA